MNEIFSSIDSDFLEILISRQNVSKLFNCHVNDFKPIESYYISRTFKRSIKLKSDILRDNNFTKSNHIVYSEEDFNKNYQDNKHIHLLRKDSNENLQWIKSKGKVSNLRNFLMTNDYDIFNEKDFFDQTDKEMIICEEPGM